MEERSLPEDRVPVVVRRRRSARARRARAAASRRAAGAACRSSISSTRHQSSGSPTERSSRVAAGRGAGPGPPKTRSSTPRAHQPSRQEYQPLPPPMPSITDQSRSGVVATSALALVDVQRTTGPVRVTRQRVARRSRRRRRGPTSSSRRDPGRACRASSTARSKPTSPPAGSGTYCAMSCSLQTTSWIRLSTSGRAMLLGTGVTRPTQWLDSDGVSSGRVTIRRGWQPGDRGVPLHHVAVGEDVRPADVEPAADLGRHRRAADQVVQHVADGDRLDPGVQPARGDHHRQPVGEVAEHLEGRRAGADDDRGPQYGRRHSGGEQDLADLATGVQVRRQLLALRDRGRRDRRSAVRRPRGPQCRRSARCAGRGPRTACRCRARGSGSRRRRPDRAPSRAASGRRRRPRRPRRRRTSRGRAAGCGLRAIARTR